MPYKVTPPLLCTFRSMKARCFNPRNKCFASYGGRGIGVCKEWMSFPGFAAGIYAELGPRPPKHTLDRIDGDGDYAPGNVRWATHTEQLRNQRRNRVIEFEGTRLCLSAWAEKSGITKAALTARLLKLGWSTERALTTPVRRRHYDR